MHVVSKTVGCLAGLGVAIAIGGGHLTSAALLSFIIVTAAVRLALGMAFERKTPA